jgi:ABC-type nickel/cobalt efflux system permease component RcnA
MSRRLRLAVIIVISQMLLIALAISWLVHMIIIAVNGSAYFVENNRFVLFSEITASVMITLFGIWVLALQLQRLGERRSTDRRPADTINLVTPDSQQRQGQSADYHAVYSEGVERPTPHVVQEQPDSHISADGGS